jgi:hypothetical protein
VADTEDKARADIRRQATAWSTGGSGALSPKSTITEAVKLRLTQILTRAQIGTLTYSTYESYKTTARLVIVPRCRGSASRPFSGRSYGRRHEAVGCNQWSVRVETEMAISLSLSRIAESVALAFLSKASESIIS